MLLSPPALQGANPSLMAAQRDESAATGILACAQEALETVHGAAFEAMQHAHTAPADGAAAPTWDAPSALAQQRASVLNGVTLMLASCTLTLKVCRPSGACHSVSPVDIAQRLCLCLLILRDRMSSCVLLRVLRCAQC